MQKGFEDIIVEEDYEPETNPESDKDDEIEDSDELIYSLREECDDDEDIDPVIKKALDALGDSTSKELLEIGKEVLLNIKGHASVENEIAIENLKKAAVKNN